MRILIPLFILSFLLHAGCPVKTYIPVKAKELAPIIVSEVATIIPEYNRPYYFQSLIEHESCVALCGNGYWARRCYSPVSELKTKREQGVGFFQLTRTFRKDGRIRWDIVATLKKKHPKELHELNWDNIKQRPDLQIKAGLLLWRDNYRKLASTIPVEERVYFADSIYNGGGYVYKERRICKLRKGCDPDVWFDNVELIKDVRGKKKLYGNRTAWDINRHHVKDVTKTRIDKYKKYDESKISYCKENNGTITFGYKF